MKRTFILPVMALLFLASFAAADLVISYPKIGGREVRKVEASSTPRITVRYKNTTGRDVQLGGAAIFLSYNPQTIDNNTLLDIKNENPDNLIEREKDLSTGGMIIYRLASTSNAKLVKAGTTIDLFTLTFHTNRDALPQGKATNLIDFSADTTDAAGIGRCQVLEKGSESTGGGIEGTDITGLFVNSPVAVESPAPPFFSGLSRVISSNSIGINNVGNTLLLDWISSAGSDTTKYFDGKLSYRVYRSLSADFSSPIELSAEKEPDHSADSDPSQRIPYTGNVQDKDYVYQDGPGNVAPSDSDPLSDGSTYWYRILAVDDTSPDPNVSAAGPIMAATPVDLTPPGKVTELSAGSDDGKVILYWTNPPDADLGGIVIMKNIGKTVKTSGDLNNVTSYNRGNYDHGPTHNVGDEPFGTGDGQIIYISPQEDYSAAAVPPSYDDYTDNGVLNYYKVFTYDRAIDGPPREMGRNYSAGMDIAKAAGKAPQAVTNFVAAKGPTLGEASFSWNNPPDYFCEGVVIRYTTDEKRKFSALTNENAGELVGVFPVTSGPDGVENYSVLFPAGLTYYFKAFAYNRTIDALDPYNTDSMAQHAFSDGQGAAIKLFVEKGEELYTYSYNFQAGTNHFAVPFPAERVTDEKGELIDVSSWEKLINQLNAQAGGNVVLTFGRWNEVTQKAEGIIDIDYSKIGSDRFTPTVGVAPSQPVLQGGAYEISISRPFTFTLKTVRNP